MKRRFPILEVMVFLILLGLLSAWGMFYYQKSMLRVRLDSLKAEVYRLAAAQNKYYSKHSKYASHILQLPPHTVPNVCVDKKDLDGDTYLDCGDRIFYLYGGGYVQGVLKLPETDTNVLIGWTMGAEKPSADWISPNDARCHASASSAVALSLCKEQCYSELKNYTTASMGIVKYCYVKIK